MLLRKKYYIRYIISNCIARTEHTTAIIEPILYFLNILSYLLQSPYIIIINTNYVKKMIFIIRLILVLQISITLTHIQRIGKIHSTNYKPIFDFKIDKPLPKNQHD